MICLLYTCEDVRVYAELGHEHEEGPDDDARPAQDDEARVGTMCDPEQSTGCRIANERPEHRSGSANRTLGEIRVTHGKEMILYKMPMRIPISLMSEI